MRAAVRWRAAAQALAQGSIGAPLARRGCMRTQLARAAEQGPRTASAHLCSLGQGRGRRAAWGGRGQKAHWWMRAAAQAAAQVAAQAAAQGSTGAPLARRGCMRARGWQGLRRKDRAQRAPTCAAWSLSPNQVLATLLRGLEHRSMGPLMPTGVLNLDALLNDVVEQLACVHSFGKEGLTGRLQAPRCCTGEGAWDTSYNMLGYRSLCLCVPWATTLQYSRGKITSPVNCRLRSVLPLSTFSVRDLYLGRPPVLTSLGKGARAKTLST